MKTRTLSAILTAAIVCAITALAILPVSVAAAQTAGSAGDGLLLEQALQRIDLALEGQQIRLGLANLTITQAREWITRIQENGRDTSTLEAALSAFEGAVRTAEAAHNNAQAIIDARAGFDANGQVVDREQARQTIKDARDAMQQCAGTVNPAAREFRQAVKDFIQSLRPQQGTAENLDFDITFVE